MFNFILIINISVPKIINAFNTYHFLYFWFWILFKIVDNFWNSFEEIISEVIANKTLSGMKLIEAKGPIICSGSFVNNHNFLERSDMRIIFMGNPQFAVPTLSNLINSRHEIVAVVSNPIKSIGRGNKKLFIK